MTIGNLPEEVLLEIFDLYRQSFCDQPSYERIWNNKNGWFKLAHVCHNWRSVVLASPSRLQVRLYFDHKTPTRAIVVERLSRLPIIVDYSNALGKAGTTKRFASALRYPDRVRRIAIQRYPSTFNEISKAMDFPFPALESLELYETGRDFNTGILVEPGFLPRSLTTSVGSLRHLRLVGAPFTSLLPLLPVTKALVDLTLDIDKVLCPMTGASLLEHLQHMPQLRNFQVTTRFQLLGQSIKELPITVLLPELTCFRFFGERAQIEWFVAGLVTPSLRELQILAIDLADISPTSQITSYLSKFIRVEGVSFLAARLTMAYLKHKISLFAYPHSIDGPPSLIATTDTLLAAQLGSALSAILGTLEDVFLSDFDNISFYYPSLLGSSMPWRKFFEEFRNVKVLRLRHGLEIKVADILRQPKVNPPPPPDDVNPDTMASSGTPNNSNESQFNLDILPSLEEIAVYARRPDVLVDERVRATGLGLFGPFATARNQVGRPVRVSWNTYEEAPRYCIP